MLCRTRRFWNWYCFMQMGKWLFLLFLHFVLFKMFCEKIENELAEGIIILLLCTTQVWFMITIEDLKGSDIPEMLDIKFLVYVSIGKMKSLWNITLQNTTERLFFKVLIKVLAKFEFSSTSLNTINFHFNPLQPGVAFLYPLKTSENLYVFCFQGVYKSNTALQWFNQSDSAEILNNCSN